jgi:hypothetical protein
MKKSPQSPSHPVPCHPYVPRPPIVQRWRQQCHCPHQGPQWPAWKRLHFSSRPSETKHSIHSWEVNMVSLRAHICKVRIPRPKSNLHQHDGCFVCVRRKYVSVSVSVQHDGCFVCVRRKCVSVIVRCECECECLAQQQCAQETNSTSQAI